MIHINIGSNLDSKYGTKFKNISIAINLLINSNLKIKKISNFYETPSYPNKKLPKSSWQKHSTLLSSCFLIRISNTIMDGLMINSNYFS